MFSLFRGRKKESKPEVPDPEENEEFEFSEPQELLVQGEIQEPILSNYDQYVSEKVPEEFRKYTQILASPGVLLGIANGMDIAILTNEFRMQRVGLLVGPKRHSSSMVYDFDLIADATKIILNVARNGTLLQAETRFPFVTQPREVKRR